MNKIIERIERQAGIPGLASILAEQLSPTDLQSLLLEVYRLRSSRLEPAAVLADFETNRFVRPSAVSPLAFLRWEQAAFSHLPPGFEPLELSPVCPLGTSSVVAPVDQNWAVSTARNTEVVSDSTNVLALECALRRRGLLRKDPKSAQAVHLAASHRLLRAQRFDSPDSVTHFGLFALCSAGRDPGSMHFEGSALRLHVGFYLAALRAYLGPDVPLHLSATDFGTPSRAEWIEAQLLSAFSSETGRVDCAYDGERTVGKGYYPGVCFHIHATTASGRRLELADGGWVDWTQQLLSNAKERLVTSGIGSERLCKEFQPACL
jgi:hypothetical protein